MIRAEVASVANRGSRLDGALASPNRKTSGDGSLQAGITERQVIIASFVKCEVGNFNEVGLSTTQAKKNFWRTSSLVITPIAKEATPRPRDGKELPHFPRPLWGDLSVCAVQAGGGEGEG